MSAAHDDIATRARRFFDATCARRQPDDASPLVGSSFRVHGKRADDFERAREFQRELFDGGLAWLTGPVELGGAGLDSAAVDAFAAVSREYLSPDRQSLAVGLLIVAPAILSFGSPEQQRAHLPGLFRGDTIACQLFSEPEAGSDLASLRTLATRADGGWLVNGQKIWSSGAQRSDIGELLARTNPNPALRNRGLSMFVIDMQSPGIEVRPIHQMNGGSHFCEVFFDDVFVPDHALLGSEGDGWRVANVSLSSERGGLSAESLERFNDLHGHLLELGRAVSGRVADVRQRLVDSHIRTELCRLLPLRLAAAGPELRPVVPSLVKLAATTTDWEIAQHAAALLGAQIVASDGDLHPLEWRDVLLAVSAPRIAGGSDQIQRNIIAERGLGLPRDQRG